jgi:hypothetical protein
MCGQTGFFPEIHRGFPEMFSKNFLVRAVGALACVAAVATGWDAEAGWRRHHRRRACCEPVECCVPVCPPVCERICEPVCMPACEQACEPVCEPVATVVYETVYEPAYVQVSEPVIRTCCR